MRYVIAMVTAVVFAAIATLYLSSPFATWVVRQYTFDSPDSVASLHAGAFMAANLAAMLAGFSVGWGLGRPFRR